MPPPLPGPIAEVAIRDSLATANRSRFERCPRCGLFECEAVRVQVDCAHSEIMDVAPLAWPLKMVLRFKRSSSATAVPSAWNTREEYMRRGRNSWCLGFCGMFGDPERKASLRLMPCR